MGGTGGPGATPTQPDLAGFAGSRAALSSGQAPAAPSDFSSWLASVPGWAENQPTSASPLVSNPTVEATSVNPTAAAIGFTHTPYQAPVSMTPIGAPAPPPPVAAAAAAAKARKAADNVRIPYGVFYFRQPEAHKAIAEITNSIRAGYDRKDYADMIPYVGGWRPDAALQEYMLPEERNW